MPFSGDLIEETQCGAVHSGAGFLLSVADLSHMPYLAGLLPSVWRRSKLRKQLFSVSHQKSFRDGDCADLL